MFDLFSWSHILILLVVALVVVGPKDLPRLMNMAGKWAGKARAMANEFRRSFDEMARESELAELRKEIEDLKNNNPVSDLANSMMGVEAEVTSSIDAVSTAPVAGSAEPRGGEFEVTESAPQTVPESASQTVQPAAGNSSS
ncbi:MAG TPA: Sec-independent protein translocase protein TatB [Rhizomicrobium sp.]|nr:Sec-independent protein translocase protein TatB [Rhizomicrobium sp.]